MDNDRASRDVELCNRHLPALMDRVRESTVPIFCKPDGVSVIEGTGTLLRIAERSFLVSAAHVLWEAQRKGLPDLPYREPKDGMFNLLAKPFRYRSNPSYKRDRLDVGIIELDADEVARLEGYRFIRLLETNTNWKPDDDLYLVAGYPTELASRNRPNQPVISACAYSCVTRLLRTDAFPDCDDKRHILLDASRQGAVLLTGTGDMPLLLDGMSGCSIWKTNLATASPDEWTPLDAVIVGVQTTAHTSPQHAIQGTLWTGVATLIYETFPSLRPSFDLVLPRR